MTAAEAIALTRASWTAPPVDPLDVAERVAVRERELVGPSRVRVVVCGPPAPAVRLFVRGGRTEWLSAYVRAAGDTDRVLEQLLERTRGRAA